MGKIKVNVNIPTIKEYDINVGDVISFTTKDNKYTSYGNLGKVGMVDENGLYVMVVSTDSYENYKKILPIPIIVSSNNISEIINQNNDIIRVR
jgi:hypothetical protein